MPTNDFMNPPASRIAIVKWVVAALLAVMLVGVVAAAYWMPVKGYAVTCKKLPTISCIFQRETANDHTTWQVALGNNALATVNVQPVRRGSARVFLYVSANSEAYFAAEFEGAAAKAQASAAAAELNHFFAAPLAGTVRVVARPPAYLTAMLWGSIGFLCLFVLVIYRAMFRRR